MPLSVFGVHITNLYTTVLYLQLIERCECKQVLLLDLKHVSQVCPLATRQQEMTTGASITVLFSVRRK